MKALWTLVTVALAATLIACAGTSANSRPTTDDLARQITDLQRQNAELRQQVARMVPANEVEGNPAVVVDTATGTESMELGATRRRARQKRRVVRPEDMIPPPAQPRRLPPQNWGWLHQPPAGCTSGVYSMQVENWTDHYVQLFIDGEEIRVRGSRGVLPGIPPREIVYLCLNNTGKHTFTGILFALRYGQPQRVGRYRFDGTWDGTSLWAQGRQQLIIRPYWITWE